LADRSQRVAKDSRVIETDLITHEEAIRLKARHFFTGEICSNGHTAERRTSDGNCTDASWRLKQDVV